MRCIWDSSLVISQTHVWSGVAELVAWRGGDRAFLRFLTAPYYTGCPILPWLIPDSAVQCPAQCPVQCPVPSAVPSDIPCSILYSSCYKADIPCPPCLRFCL